MSGEGKDLLRQCMSSVNIKNQQYADFKKFFCDRCYNTDCTRSGQVDNAWFKRVSTQVDRLLENPNIANYNDPRFRDIVNQRFEDKRMEADRIVLSQQRGDWSIPTDEEVKQYQQSKGMASGFVSEPEKVESNEVLDTVEEAVVEEEFSSIQVETKPVVKTNTQVKDVSNPFANTGNPTEGIMLGGKKNSKPKEEVNDPWSIPSKEDSFVDMGATIVLGGKKPKP